MTPKNIYEEVADERVLLLTQQFSTSLNILGRIVQNYKVYDSDDQNLFIIAGGGENYRVLTAEQEFPGLDHTFIQLCLRTDSEYKIGFSEKHLTCFLMGGFQAFAPKELFKILESTLIYLEQIGLSRDKLIINIPVTETPVLKDILLFLKGLNVDVYFLPKNGLSIQIKKCPYPGERIEIFYKDREIELINLSLIYHPRGLILDAGFSFERLAICKHNLKSVFELAPYSKYQNGVVELAAHISVESSRCLADHLLAIDLAINQGVRPSPKGRGNKIRYLIKKVCARMRIVATQPVLLSELVSDNSRESVVQEIKLDEKNTYNARAEFIKYLESMSRFDLEQYLNMRKSTGTSGLFDSPKLLNEEMLWIAHQNGKLIFNHDSDMMQFGKKFNVPLDILFKLQSERKCYE